MPIHSPWRPASADHIRLNVPHEPGVYELKSFGNLVYVGGAEDLREALLGHLDERSPNYYRVETPELLESVDDLYERHIHRYEREHGELPTWNQSEETAAEASEPPVEDDEPGEDAEAPDATADDEDETAVEGESDGDDETDEDAGESGSAEADDIDADDEAGMEKVDDAGTEDQSDEMDEAPEDDGVGDEDQETRTTGEEE